MWAFLLASTVVLLALVLVTPAKGAVFFFLALVVALLLYMHWPMLRALWYYRHIKGPPPLPLFGNALTFVKNPNIHLVYEEWQKQYGPVFKWFMSNGCVIVFCDMDSIREVGLRKFSVFTNRDTVPSTAKKFLTPTIQMTQKYGLLRAKDKYWKGMRSTANSIFHNVETLSSFCPLMKETATELAERLAEVKEGEAIDIWRAFGDMTLDVIGSTVFGVRFNSVQRKGADAVKAARIVFANASVFGRTNPYLFFAMMAPSFMTPLLQFLARKFPTQRMKEQRWATDFLGNVSDEMYELAQKENQTKKEEGREGGNESNAEEAEEAEEGAKTAPPAGVPSYDFTGNSFLKLFINSHSRVTGESLKREEVVSQAFTFLLAGYETTANTLAQTVYLLCKHKDKEQALIDEIDRLKAKTEDSSSDPLPLAEELKSYVYVEACVKEALRMVGPAPLVTREAADHTVIGGKRVAKGSGVHLGIYALHMNPEYFPSPSTFMPERFIPGTETYDLQNHKAFMPFGLGPRMCVAWNFAMTEAKLALITLYRKYSFEHNPTHEYKNSLSITLSPVNGIEVLVHKR